MKLEAQERTARIAEGPARRSVEVDRRCCCSAASTAAAARFASRSSTASRRLPRRPSSRPPGSFASRSAKRSCRWPARRRQLGDGKVRLFRLNDGAHEIGYAFAEVHRLRDHRK